MTKSLDEVIILNDSTYDRVLDMLCSPDRDNAQVAVSIIEAVDFEKNAPYILLLAKESEGNLTKNNNPFRTNLFAKEDVVEPIGSSFNSNIANLVNSCSNDAGKLTYNKMYTELSQKKTDAVAMTFFLDKFSESLKTHLLQWGFDFVHTMNLKLIPKTESND